MRRLIGVIVLFCWAGIAHAQLISPGKLIKGHQFLEGVTNCTNCHQLGKKGISNSKCLDCHTPVKETNELKRGYHAQKDVLDKNCASCHKEHFGVDFDMIRFDSTAFDHKKTAFELIGKHSDVFCASCHTGKLQENKTLAVFGEKFNVKHSGYMGLGLNCESCHTPDNPHEKQFEEVQCKSCHTPLDWKNLDAFNHQKTNFPLLGEHVNVKCESCHKPIESNPKVIQYKGLAFESCVSCHEDVHKKRLGNDCQSCHNEKSFHNFINFPEKTFPHEETGFKLLGSHSKAECSSCHKTDVKRDRVLYSLSYVDSTRKYTYPHPASVNCTSCHLDIHKGRFNSETQTLACTECHTEEVWKPSLFDVDNHNKKSVFKLTGAHIATPCFQCHSTGSNLHDFPNFSMKDKSCFSCHEKVNPHGKEFEDENGNILCETCHGTQSWKLADFNHDKTEFPLTGKHAITTCENCHIQDVNGEKRFSIKEFECVSCHQKDDPHEGQFKQSNIGKSCDVCHDNQQFTIALFNHDKTRFSLKGAHESVACASCHKQELNIKSEPFTRFVPVSIECKDCHGE